jgi:hypothetical protein
MPQAAGLTSEEMAYANALQRERAAYARKQIKAAKASGMDSRLMRSGTDDNYANSPADNLDDEQPRDLRSAAIKSADEQRRAEEIEEQRTIDESTGAPGGRKKATAQDKLMISAALGLCYSFIGFLPGAMIMKSKWGVATQGQKIMFMLSGFSATAFAGLFIITALLSIGLLGAVKEVITGAATSNLSIEHSIFLLGD